MRIKAGQEEGIDTDIDLKVQQIQSSECWERPADISESLQEKIDKSWEKPYCKALNQPYEINKQQSSKKKTLTFEDSKQMGYEG